MLERMPKRVKANPHLHFHYESNYLGLPVCTKRGPLVAEYLEKAYTTIMEALQSHSRLYAVRIDLRFPKWYWPIEGHILGNDFLTTFQLLLKCKVEQKQRNSAGFGYRVHPHDMRLLWTREYEHNETKPHFHLLLLFNGHSINNLGSFKTKEGNLYRMINDAWSKALGLQPQEAYGLVHYPEEGQYRLSLRDQAALRPLFFRVSYMTKVATKSFHDGCHPFGGSRSRCVFRSKVNSESGPT